MMKLKFTDAKGKVLVIDLDYLASTYGLEAPVIPQVAEK